MHTHKKQHTPPGRRRTRALLAAAVASAVTLAGGVALAPAASAVPATPAPAIDYFADSFDGLRAGSVFTPVTFERFERLLERDGTYAFLIGGPADPTTQATVAAIDEAAQAHGIDTVYAFDPRLDGAGLDIRTTASAPLRALYTRIAETLNRDTEPAFGDPSTDPYLFIYDRSHTVDGVEDRIVAQIAGAQDAASIDLDAYRLELDALFSQLAQTDEQSQFEFFRDAMNQRHAATYADAALFGGDILTAADGADFVLQSVTYPELVHILESDGEHVILFGGTWCHNTRAVVQRVNQAAATAGVDTVYVFDLKLDGLSNAPAHIRDSASEFSYLYGDLVAQHLPGLRTQYEPAVSAGQRVEYFPGGDTGAPRATARKLQVPYLISYDRSAAAPITRDWLRENADGSVTEYMTEWWWVSGLPGKNSRNLAPEAWAAQQAQQWAFAAEGVAKIDAFFGLAGAPAAPATPLASVTGDAVTVTWDAPADGGSALTGFELALDGGAPIVLPANARAHAFTGVAPGDHTVTVTAVNRLGSAASAPARLRVEAPPRVPAVTVEGELHPGGAITVRGSGFAAGDVTVEVHSTPQRLGAATAAPDGTFSLRATLPTSIASGAHSIVVLAGGVEIARAAVTLTAAPAGGGGAATASVGGLATTGGPGIPTIALGVAAVLLLGGAGALLRRRTGV